MVWTQICPLHIGNPVATYRIKVAVSLSDETAPWTWVVFASVFRAKSVRQRGSFPSTGLWLTVNVSTMMVRRREIFTVQKWKRKMKQQTSSASIIWPPRSVVAPCWNNDENHRDRSAKSVNETENNYNNLTVSGRKLKLNYCATCNHGNKNDFRSANDENIGSRD